MFTKLSAVCLLVKNFDISLAFYRDKLQLRVNEINGRFADFQLGDTSLAIFEKGEAVAMFPSKYMKPGGGCVLAVNVDDLPGACQFLQNQQIEVFEGPKTTPWGQTVAYFADPDGHIWELS